MKMILQILFFVLSTTSIVQADRLVTFEGQISRVSIGEVDPYLIGDVCIVELKVSSGNTIGLVTDYDECSQNREELQRGRGLTVVIPWENKVLDPEKHQLLRYASRAQVFYEVEFGGIENGLADLPADESDNMVTIKEKEEALFECSFGKGDDQYQVGIVANPYMSTGFDFLIINKNKMDHVPWSRDLVFIKPIISCNQLNLKMPKSDLKSFNLRIHFVDI